MVTQTFHGPHDLANKPYKTITFGKHTPTGTQKQVADAWDVTIPPRPEAEDVATRIEAFTQLRKKYRGQPDVLDMVLHAPPETWETTLLEWNKTAPIGDLLARHSVDIHRRARDIMNDRRSPAETYEHVVSHLDTTTVIEEFTAAALTLGNTVTNMEDAYNKDPDAFHAFRSNGLKLRALDGLAVFPGFTTEPRGNVRAARYTSITNLPRLSAYYIKGTGHPTHTPEDLAVHTEIQQATQLAEDNIDAYITRLARGDYSRLTLNIAENEDQLRERVALFGSLGIIDTIPVPKGVKGRRRGNSHI